MRYLTLFICLLMFCSCNKDFLRLEPKSDANSKVFYKTQEDFKTALNGIYASLRSYPNMYLEMSSFRSDELLLAAPTAGTQDRYDLDKFQDNPSNGILLSQWGNFYNGIALCNELIARLPEASFAQNLKRQYEAEARFVRAYHYFNLVNYWGRVPLVLSPLTPAQALETGQADIPVLYQAIEADLSFAASSDNLPASFTGNEMGRATSVAASALLAKVYLAQKKYKEAKDVLEPFIGAGGAYDLLDDVTNVFSVSNKMNKEVIFAVRFNKNLAGQGHGLWLSTSSASASQIPPSMINSYQTSDKRKPLLEMVRSGTSGNNYVPRKFLDTYSTTIVSQVGNDYILLRYADVLLMYAEAANEESYSSNGNAFTALNRIRRRAGLELLTGTQLASQAEFRAAILEERKLELPYEGHRWFDLVRTGKANQAIQSAEAGTVPDFRLLYPIPNNEIEKINNPNLLKQNNGY